VAFGVDVTVSEMAQSNKLLAGEQNEWTLLRRHHTERKFGVQLTGCHVDTLASCVELLNDNELDIDFIDLKHVGIDFFGFACCVCTSSSFSLSVSCSCGCPIDSEVNFGRGSGILQRPRRLEVCLRAMSQASQRLPITMKMRIGFDDNHLLGTSYIPFIRRSGIAALTVHGRTRQQRYARLADWDYVGQCARAAAAPTPADLLDAESCGMPFEPMPVIGNGDIFCFQDYQRRLQTTKCDAVMIGRGALIKPWLFTEIKEQRDWDISGSERMDIVRDFCHFGLEHWGSDSIGVDRTRRFLLEWLSFAHRYVPNALLEVTPCQLTWRPPPFIGRDDRETLLASDQVADWIKISEMYLGKAGIDFAFQPKHRSNSYSATSFLNADELQNYKFGCMT
jgi:tRNA-dihydrouridine synthase 3